MSRNKICCCKLKKHLLKKVDASSTCCNMLLQLATTKFGCVTMFEVGGNTCNNAFQLATQQCCVQVEEKCCPYYRAFIWVEFSISRMLRVFFSGFPPSLNSTARSIQSPHWYQQLLLQSLYHVKLNIVCVEYMTPRICMLQKLKYLCNMKIYWFCKNAIILPHMESYI